MWGAALTYVRRCPLFTSAGSQAMTIPMPLVPHKELSGAERRGAREKGSNGRNAAEGSATLREGSATLPKGADGRWRRMNRIRSEQRWVELYPRHEWPGENGVG
jgi:hypothetical protein